mmetsp:Transcript_28090/g.43522  ORF Transcript_28090/g.43522 Transcript_28090/m.43522 type:complete len:292 (-) Transcript_28090:98-973(-)|eukprot:CAMPEP_0201522566 /NCGR_PEP_ID=MMETSP0161_2-20130828/18141_1 /ASSEMBLY_ACC=CAM_ASM_000251 /TAXON_ID=180227 /ORGANISM="Neoparamoeba aestuarina, Strain SoJaBio B1-5/56/2" /LENGTH=291 /DNA_ID=CAMNT_0047921455 /DNA_START=36 /DNA_END=911 /DNA_ORIENTATION=+
MAVFFKDFDRDIDCFFKKNYIECNKGQFRLESNRKPIDEKIYLNNLFEGNTFSLNMHYDSAARGLNTKLSLFSNGTVGSSIVWKYIMGNFQNAIEFREQFDMHNLSGFKGELSHRSATDAVSIESKHVFSPKSVAKSDVGVALGVPSIKGLSVGCGLNFDSASTNGSPLKYGAQYKAIGNSLVTFSGDQSGAYAVGVLANVKDFINSSCDATAVVQLTNKANKWAVNLGAAATEKFTGALIRVKTDLDGKYGISFTRALNDVAKFNIGFEGSCRDGLKLPTDSFTFSVVTE